MAQTKRVRCRIDGVLLLDKPAGITSNAAIQRVKRIFNAEKTGHVGTLDPMATGLLPVCLGEATKFSTGAFNADKSYEAHVQLGVITATGDLEGEILERRTVDVTRPQVEAVLRRFVGPIEQTPPMYSALKRDGKPLYAYAREGITVERAARRVTVQSIDLLDLSGDRMTIDVSCSKGTYIRVLAEDIGATLGCGAALAGLRRTRVGVFTVERALSLVGIEAMADGERMAALMPVDSLASELPAIELDEEVANRLLMGQATRVDPARAGSVAGAVRVYSPGKRFVGLAELQASGELVAKRLISSPASPKKRAAPDSASPENA